MGVNVFDRSKKSIQNLGYDIFFPTLFPTSAQHGASSSGFTLARFSESILLQAAVRLVGHGHFNQGSVQKRLDMPFERTRVTVHADDGYTLTDLEHSGCSLESPKRQALLHSTLNGFGVKLVDRRIETHAGRDNFAVKKHDLIQAILSVDDLFCLAEPTVASIFHEDVVSWLDANDIRYAQNVKLAGKTGYDHRFDFIIPKSKNAPERVLQTINHPSKSKAELLLFARMDTQAGRFPDTEYLALLNDREKRFPREFQLLSQTGAFPFLRGRSVNLFSHNSQHSSPIFDHGRRRPKQTGICNCLLTDDAAR